MNKKTAAIILELIPIVSALLSLLLIVMPLESGAAGTVIAITMLLASFGFVFFIFGRVLAKDDKMVKILGIFDWLATVYVICIYVLVFLALAG